MTRRQFSLTLASATAGVMSASNKSLEAKDTLRTVGNRCSLNVGYYTGMSELKNPNLCPLILEHFNVISCGNAFKWVGIHPAQDTYNWPEADWVVNFTQQHNLIFHGHNLCWNPYNPLWLEKVLTRANAVGILYDHITKVVSRYAGKVESWDVVNEPVSWSGPNGMYPGIWLKALGPQYIDIAFKAAQAADPKALRVLNLHHVEQDGKIGDATRAASLGLIQSLLKRNVPLQVIGFESHLDGSRGGRSDGCAHFMQQIRSMGLQVSITELDVDDTNIPDNNPGDFNNRDERVAVVYHDYLSQMIRAGSIKEVIFFSLSDRKNWYDWDPAPQFVRADQQLHRPALFDKNMQPKPAYQAVHSAFSKICPNNRGMQSPN